MQIFHSSLLFHCMFFNRWCFLAAYSLLCRLPLRDTSICYGYQYMYEFRRLSFDLCFNMIRFFFSLCTESFMPPFVCALLNISMWKFLFIHFFVVFFLLPCHFFMHKGQEGWMRLAHSHAISILLTFSLSLSRLLCVQSEFHWIYGKYIRRRLNYWL